MVNTVRQQIMANVKAAFTGMQSGSPVGDPYSVTWDIVTRNPVTDNMVKGQAYVLGIYDNAEEPKPAGQHNYPYDDRIIRLILEFHTATGFANEEVGDTLNRVLGDIQRKVMEDLTWGGLAYDTVEDRNELSVDGYYAAHAAGTLFYTISYRRKTDDPRVGT